MRDKPKKEREAHAEKETGDDWEIEGGVFATVDDVAGQAAEAERELAAKVEESTEENQEDAENQEQAAEFTEGIHEEHSSGTAHTGYATIEERFLRSAGRRPRNADGGKSRPAPVGMTE